MSLPEPSEVLNIAQIIHDENAVNAAYDRIAEAMTKDLAELNPLLYCVMNGGIYAAAEITKRLKFPLELGYVHATRYQRAFVGGALHWRARAGEEVRDRHVVLIDDILDEGYTLVGIKSAIEYHKPASIRIATLVNKIHDRRCPDITATYCGLDAPDVYLFGCGMDYKGYWRQLPAIYGV